MEDALYNAGLKVLEHSEGVLEVPQLSEMIQTLIGLLQQCTNVVGPCQVLGDVDAEVFEAFHPLQLGPDNAEGEPTPLLFPGEVHCELLGLTGVQFKVVLSTPVSEVGDLRPVGCLVAV